MRETLKNMKWPANMPPRYTPPYHKDSRRADQLHDHFVKFTNGLLAQGFDEVELSHYMLDWIRGSKKLLKEYSGEFGPEGRTLQRKMPTKIPPSGRR